MDLQAQAKIGVQAGLLAGTVVAAIFFVADLARLAPLATPVALSCSFLLSCEMSFDTPFVVESVTIISLGGRLAALTLLHLLVFAALGAGAVVVSQACRVPMNALTGALYGLVACTVVFYTAFWLSNATTVIALPSLGSILLVNLLAGAVMGGYFQLASRKAKHTA